MASTLFVDPIAEDEMSMRLLIRETAPWLLSLGQDVVPLTVPAILLRTESVASDDAMWKQRCPNIRICELPGMHHTLFEPQNLGALRKAFLNAAIEFCSSI
jgi:hypothetical protein